METIRNYIEMMFKDFPKTKEVIDMKMNILDHMEDKYNELIQEGKTENEAIGTVISQFGNIDECKEELGLPVNESETPVTAVVLPYKDEDEVLNYLRFKIKFGYLIGIGVALCIISVIPPTFDTIGDIGTILFFMIVAMGVAIFIIAGIKNSEYDDFEKETFSLREPLKKRLQDDYQYSKKGYTIGITTGVVLCIMAPMAYLLVENFFEMLPNYVDMNLTEGFASAFLFLFVAIAVFLFISVGIKQSAYEMILQNGKKRTERNEEEKNDRLYEIVMPLTAILYLVLGFCFGLWHPGWIIFPLAAILVYGYNAFRNKDFE